MKRSVAVLVLTLLAGRARAAPETVVLAETEGPFASAFDDKCQSSGALHCRRIASARVAPFQRVELYEADGAGYVALEREGQWFVGPPISIHGVSDPTTSQSVAVTFARFTTEPIPDLGQVAVLRLGLHVTMASHCSRRGAGCTPGAPGYRSVVDGEYDDDVFMICGVDAGRPPRCSPPIAVPEELVTRPPFTSGALVLSAACARFDWGAHRRSYDHANPGQCRYEFSAPTW